LCASVWGTNPIGNSQPCQRAGFGEAISPLSG
jgi:hypothetical protein